MSGVMLFNFPQMAAIQETRAMRRVRPSTSVTITQRAKKDGPTSAASLQLDGA
jgi:hypothetical protein